MKTTLCSILSLLLFSGVAFADTCEKNVSKEDPVKPEKKVERIDRSQRTSPTPSTPSYAVGSSNEASRYRTDQGWSRGRGHYWWGGSYGSDIPTSGYTSPRGGR